ncbi:MAG: hypothetical protein MZU79_09215 [Anaerotruncus sp.]|nr:hypothetical protein [Anaerotruncus sp.]
MARVRAAMKLAGVGGPMAYLEGALALESSFVLRLPMFEGPLDRTCTCIEKNRFTLKTLEVCPIIDQYLAS